MRQSELFTKTQKQVPKDEETKNAQLLIRAGFVHKEMAGVYSYLPLGLRVLNKIAAIIREELLAVGAQELSMPTLQPKENWEKTGRWADFDVLFKLKSQHGSEYALGPTHEEIVVPLMREYITSYRDLPKALFQFQAKFRDEKRAKSGLLRGREFLMKDLYSFHANEDDMNQYYEKLTETYTRIFDRIGIGENTYITFASGGTFSKYSHEFQMLTEAGEDTIYICGHCRIAINDEIIADQPTCPQCGNADFQTAKAVELGNIFKLKTKYAEPFDLTYTDQAGAAQTVYMGCYGIGLPRVMGAVVEALHDEKGMVWPQAVAPFQVHLLALPGGETAADNLYTDLQKRGIDVLYDDRAQTQAGEKFADADLYGIPWRLVVSKKTLAEDHVEIKERTSAKGELIGMSELPSKISKRV